MPAGRAGSPLGSSGYTRRWGGGRVATGTVPVRHASATRPAAIPNARRIALLHPSTFESPRAPSTRRATSHVAAPQELGARGRSRPVPRTGRLAHQRLLLVVELDVRLVEERHIEIEREVPGRGAGKREARMPAVQIALQAHVVREIGRAHV